MPHVKYKFFYMTKDIKNKKGSLIAELSAAIETVLKQNDSDSSKKVGKAIKSASEEVAKKFLKRVKQKDKKAQKAKNKATVSSKAKPAAKTRKKKEPVV